MLFQVRKKGVDNTFSLILISLTRDPAFSALLKAANVFSGASLPPARCDIT